VRLAGTATKDASASVGIDAGEGRRAQRAEVRVQGVAP